MDYRPPHFDGKWSIQMDWIMGNIYRRGFKSVAVEGTEIHH